MLVQHGLSFSQFRKVFGLEFNADIPRFLVRGRCYRYDVTFKRALGLSPDCHESMRAWLKIRIAQHNANPKLAVALKQLIDAELVVKAMRDANPW
jgi:hypothetical protein